MFVPRQHMRVPARLRALAAALLPAVCLLGTLAMSPLGAELAYADGTSAASRSLLTFGGLTSDGWPVVAEVTSDGRRVKRIVGAIDSKCSQGGSYAVPSQWRDLRIRRSGAFKASYHDTGVVDGVELTMSETLVGKVNRARTKLTGTWRASTTFKNPDGTTDVCDSGSLRFNLHR
ncbi:MAG TPA: hypothetical protein VF072_11200 [Thermoleophilaceae bacterium]